MFFSKRETTAEKIVKKSPVLLRIVESIEKMKCNSSEILSKLNAGNLLTYDEIGRKLITHYDKCRTEFNELDIKHHVCSLIRALNLTGQCKWTRELLRGNAGFYRSFMTHQKACVRQQAKEQLLKNDGGQQKWTERQVDQAIEDVFMRCYMDTEPLWHPMTD